eukprot:357425-Chlamydomonas_euryale.AAC.8
MERWWCTLSCGQCPTQRSRSTSPSSCFIPAQLKVSACATCARADREARSLSLAWAQVQGRNGGTST